VNHSKKNRILKDVAVYSLASYIVQVLGIVNSIALRGFMGPAAMGVWSIIQVILGYCGYASFGTTKAMARDYPYLRGRGEHEKAEELKDMILTFSLLMSFIPAALISLYLALRWRGIEPSFRIGLVFLVVFLFLQRFYDLVITLLRADRKFDVLSRLIVINAAGGLGATFLLVSWGNIYGLYAGTGLVTLSCFLWLQKVSPYHFRYSWEPKKIVRELRLGIPLLVIAFLAQFLRSMDKLILVKHLGFYEVGLYSLVMMASSYVQSLHMLFAHVLFPNIQEEYGKKGSAAAIKGYLLKPVFAFSVLIPFLCGACIIGVPVIVALFLPKFEGGILAMKIYLVGTYFLMLVTFSSNFLLTLDKHMANIPILISSIGVNYFLNLAFLKAGWGFVGVAAGTTLSFVLYGLATFILAFKHCVDPREVVRTVTQLLGILALFFGGIFLLDGWVSFGNLYQETLVKFVLLAVLSAPFFWFLEKKIGIWAPLRQTLIKRTAPKVPEPEKEFQDSEGI